MERPRKKKRYATETTEVRRLQPAVPLPYLPTEILMYIFGFIPPGDAFRVAMCCTEWAEIMRRIRTSQGKTTWYSPPQGYYARVELFVWACLNGMPVGLPFDTQCLENTHTVDPCVREMAQEYPRCLILFYAKKFPPPSLTLRTTVGLTERSFSTVIDILQKLAPPSSILPEHYKALLKYANDLSVTQQGVKDAQWIHAEIAYTAIRTGAVDLVLDMIHRKILIPGNRFEDACTEAARWGHVDVVDVMQRNGFPLDERVFERAAQSRHVAVLRYLAEKNCPGYEEILKILFTFGDNESVAAMIEGRKRHTNHL